MKPRIYDWRFRDRRLEALYVEDHEPAGVALREDLSPKARRAPGSWRATPPLCGSTGLTVSQGRMPPCQTVSAVR
jgi:hypothetical protein